MQEVFGKLDVLQAHLKEGKISMQMVVNRYLQNIENHKHLNAFVHVWADSAMEIAKSIDKKINEGHHIGKLFGAVITIKDNICYKNHSVSAASHYLKKYVSPYSATVVQRLLDEDAIIIASTNCDEFGMGSTSTNTIYGPVRNGVDEEKIAGGSSGGAAVSVQMDCCLLALGSDTGGSIRQPAAFCHVLGFKPSYGSVSRHGLIAYASSFDQIGILSKDIDSLSLAYSIMNGLDEYDSTLVEYPKVKYDENLEDMQTVCIREVKEKVNPHVNGVLEYLESNFNLSYKSFKYIDYLIPCYYILTTAEASTNLSRYDGVRYGYRSPSAKSLEEMYIKSRTEGFGREVKKRIMLGTFVLSEGYFDSYYGQAQKVRRLIRDKVNSLLDDADALVMPVVTNQPWPIDFMPTDPVEIYLSDIFTVLANLTGMPAITLNVKNSDKENGLAFQIMVKQGEDWKLLQIAKQILEKQSPAV